MPLPAAPAARAPPGLPRPAAPSLRGAFRPEWICGSPGSISRSTAPPPRATRSSSPPGQPLSSPAQQQIENVIANLDGAQSSVLSAEAALGATLAQIQAVAAQDQTQGTDAGAALANLQSANLPQVLANYSAGVTALQAAELAFAKIENLTLFAVIRP